MAYYRTMFLEGKPKSEPLRKPGDIINNKYTVAQKIGSGASGEVLVVADREKNNELVALKYLKLDPKFETAIFNFKSEFETMTHLNHPNIARVYDFGWDDELKFYFFTSELIDGIDFINATRNLDIEQIEELLIQSLRALEYLHGHNIFHYDIKHQNILVQGAGTSSPSAKIIDFGLASATPSEKLVGTPSYIAPEMILKNKPDGRADLYSLGVLAYFALTMINPFRGASKQDTLQNHLEVVPIDPLAINPAIPQYLASIVMKLMERNPADRYATAAEVIRDINFRSPRFYAIETPTTLLSYVPWEGPFVGRNDQLTTYKNWLCSLREQKNSSAFWTCGDMGTGKSRFLEECKNIAQLENFNTIFVNEVGYRLINRIQGVAQDSIIIIDDFEKALLPLDEKTAKDVATALSSVNVVISTSESVAANLAVDDFLKKAGIDRIQKIDLKDFNIKEIGEYIKTLTGLKEAPTWLIRSLYSFTAGNPFFITEALKQMVTSGLLFDQRGRWKKSTMEDIGIEISNLEIPRSVSKKLNQHLCNISEREKDLLSFISACRTPVGLNILKDIYPYDIDRALKELVAQKILSHNKIDDSYFFKNALLKLAVYKETPKADREVIHDKLAKYLLSHGATEVSAAYHIQRGSDKKQARAALLSEIHNSEEGLNIFDIIEEFLSRFGDNLDDDVVFMTILKARKYALLRKYNKAHEIYDALSERLPPLDAAPKWHFELLMAVAALFQRERRLEEAIAHIKDAKKLLPKTKDPASPIIIENHLAYIDLLMGNFDYAIEKYAENRKKAKKLNKKYREKITNNDLGHAYFYKNMYEDAVDILEDDASLFRKINDKRKLCHTLYSLGEAYRHLRKFEKAENIFNEIIRAAKEIGYIETLYRAYVGVGSVLNERGNYSDSIGYLDRALDLAIHLGDYDSAAAIMINIGILYSNINDIKKSFDTFETAIGFLSHKDFPVATRELYICKANLELGELYRIGKKFNKAEEHLKNALELAKKPEAKQTLFWILLTVAKLAKDKKDEIESKSFMDQAKKLADSTDKKKLFEEVKEYVTSH